jgi:hypothetical protein
MSPFGSGRQRRRGRPPGGNGASSFHLWWRFEAGDDGRDPLVEAEAVLEVVEAPITADLHFWALQVSFVDRGRRLGAAHTGLQWNPDAPGGAVNWGGYDERGAELAGSDSGLAPADSVNTRRWPWSPGRPYRLWVHRVAGGWRSEVTDLAHGRSVVVRDLWVEAPALADPVVWAEVFAPCEARSAVRWSALSARTTAGRLVRPASLEVSYQSVDDGGCTNTDVVADPAGVRQVTGTPRITPNGALVVPGAG